MALHVPPVANETDAALADPLARGATVNEDARDFGGGYRGAVAIEPFCNAFGIMQRPVVPTTGAPEADGEAA